MPRILPSDIVTLIETSFPSVTRGGSSPGVNYSNAAAVGALVEAVAKVPESLLALPSNEYRDFLTAVAGLTHLVRRIEAGIVSAGTGWPVPTAGNADAITRLWQLMKQCPDEGIAPPDTLLNFIGDEDLRRNLRQDIFAAEEALNSGNWKAATVLGGALVEALLLWSIAQHERVEIERVIARSFSASAKKPDPARPENWDLSQYILVAKELAEISNSTAEQAKLAKDFRNLIHPGREQRMNMRCDRATARSAMAAVDHVTREIGRRSPSPTRGR